MFLALSPASLIVLLGGLCLLVVVMLIVSLVLLRRTRKLQAQCELERGTDALTGLWNRQHFMELAERQVNYVQRTGRKAALLIIDLDECKKINERYGLQAGDLAVQAVARAAQETLRDYDLLGRYSGEELVVLLPDTSLEGAQAVARRLRDHLATQEVLVAEGKPIPVTVSMGIAAIRTEIDTLEDLLVAADAALASVIVQGPNRVGLQE